MSPARLLAFEARWPGHTSDKGEAIRHQLGLSPARYYQLLMRAASSLEGIAADALTARGVRDQAESRAAAREQRMRPAA